MTSQPYPWIRRQASDDIYQKILERPDGVYIYLLEAPAGVGKTYLARDIGVRLGSKTGYEAGHTEEHTIEKEDIYWSGIIDLYDPDTNSKRIERRWIDAFGSLTGFEFSEYERKRDFYNISAAKAAAASDLEHQIEEIRTVFAEGMEDSIKDHYPVMAFDTIERLQTILDPAQQKLDIQAIERPDILVWLFHQLTRLSKGVILMVGRPAPDLTKELERKMDEINPQRRAKGLQPISLNISSLEKLIESEQEDFFQRRINEHPELEKLLGTNLKSLLKTHTEGNPLLLDIAIQTLLETRKPGDVEKALKGPKGIKAVEETLLSAYMNLGSPERKNLLAHLAIARNGLFDELLRHLDEANYSKLLNELHKMEPLPFIKVREIYPFGPLKEQNHSERTYFLHDEMYAICDRVGLIRAEQVREDSKKIVAWYDAQIEQHPNTGGRIPDEIKDLLIESLPYRMRSAPQSAYQWFIEQSDKAIRSAERGLDLRLQGAMAQFMSSASDKDQSGELPNNAIDCEILLADAPQLHEDFEIDSTLLWLKRYSVRSKHKEALEIAGKATFLMEDAYKSDHDRYLIKYAEFLLWQGQSLMYIGKPEDSLIIYNQALTKITTDQLESRVKSKEILNADDSRICQVLGRLYNNRGYVYWYKGLYWLAIDEFKEALRYFKLANLVEEMANSKDNMGRVYATLGYNFQAFEEIGEGLQLRIAAGSPYREALSRISLAIIYFRFNNATRGLEEVEMAHKIFERFEVERGIALAYFTRGVAYRRRAREVGQNPILTEEQAKDQVQVIEYIEKAERELLRALRIFSETVQEPIRKIQIYNELACVYRTRYLLFKNKNDQMQNDAFKRSKSYFDLAIDFAEKGGFPIPGLDSIQDRAVLYAYAGQYDQARIDIATACDLIPAQYQIKADGQGLPSLSDGEQRVDAYYRLMGQVEELIATIVYEESLPGKQIPEEMMQTNLLDMLEHYTLASAYLNAFSSEAFLQQQTHSHVYAKLRGSPREFILNIREKYLPNWLEKYNLPAEPIRSQFDGIFNALLPGNRNWGQSSRR